MHFRPELSWEFLTAEEIAAKTIRALRNHIRHVKECSSFYKSYFENFRGEDILSIDAFEQLPFTSRKQIEGNSSQFLAVDPDQIVETVLTAGTCGKALPFVFTSSDLERIAFSYALSLHSVGMSPNDRVLILESLNRCSIDGMSLYRGTLMTHANVMRAGVGSAAPGAATKYIQFFKPTILIGSPSVLLTVASECRRDGYDTVTSPIQKIIGCSEPLLTNDLLLNSTAIELETMWNAQIFSLYSATELAVSYCTSECGSGAHAHPELVYTEIVDASGKVLPDGEIGELVATPLGVEGVPLVRYRTGDLTFKVPGSCSCGRNSVRIGPVLGRVEHLFNYQGTTIYPHRLTAALDSIEEIKDHLTVIENDGNCRDSATIHIAAAPSALEKTSQAIKAATGVYLQVLISNVPTIQSMRGASGTNVSVLDKRMKVGVSV